LALALCTVLLRDQIEDRAVRAMLLTLHQCCGITVLGLACLRLVGRLRWIGQSWESGPRWSSRLAAAAHAALYGAMLVVPLLGWAIVTASGKRPPWGVSLPAVWFREDEDLADRLGDWHRLGAYWWLLLIGAHVAAALWHHWVLRDDVLRSMRLRRSIPSFPSDPRTPR
jgi:cytochrome b561